MTVEELKKYPDGVCLGSSTIKYMLKQHPHICGKLLQDFVHLDEGLYREKFYPERLYPVVGYFKNAFGVEKLLCRVMLNVQGRLTPVGIIARMNRDKFKIDSLTYVAKSYALPLDYDIDSLFEDKEYVRDYAKRSLDKDS